jgi:hypothetical protein
VVNDAPSDTRHATCNGVCIVSVKGKCALGLFLSILVIKCPTQVPSVKILSRTEEVKIKIKVMFLDLVHCFED